LQKDLAKRIGVSEDTIVNWEQNHSYPKISKWGKLIAFLGYNPEHKVEDTVAAKLWNYRRNNGMTRNSLAKLIGVDTSTVYWWEQGREVKHARSREQLETFFARKGKLCKGAAQQ